jgi:hypothetical protein
MPDTQFTAALKRLRPRFSQGLGFPDPGPGARWGAILG